MFCYTILYQSNYQIRSEILLLLYTISLFLKFSPWQLKPWIIFQHKLTSLFQQHGGVWAGLLVKLWDADLYGVWLGQYYEVAEMVKLVQIQIQHTWELINTQKTSHKRNNKDLSHLR